MHVRSVHEKRLDQHCGECDFAASTRRGNCARLLAPRRAAVLVFLASNGRSERGLTNFPHWHTNFASRRPLGLQQHYDAIHAKLKPYQCQQCMRWFSQKAHVDRHVAAVHEGRHDYNCGICSVSFTVTENSAHARPFPRTKRSHSPLSRSLEFAVVRAAHR